MGICTEELRTFVIRPTLKQLGEWTQAAENLLLGTAAQESGLGFHLQEQGRGGLGIYQITPAQHISVWDTYLVSDPDLASEVRGLASQHEFLANPHMELATNLSYATAIAWMLYRRANKPLPDEDDAFGMAVLWAHCFHYPAPASVEDFMENYRKLVVAENGDVKAA